MELMRIRFITHYLIHFAYSSNLFLHNIYIETCGYLPAISSDTTILVTSPSNPSCMGFSLDARSYSYTV